MRYVVEDVSLDRGGYAWRRSTGELLGEVVRVEAAFVKRYKTRGPRYYPGFRAVKPDKSSGTFHRRRLALEWLASAPPAPAQRVD